MDFETTPASKFKDFQMAIGVFLNTSNPVYKKAFEDVDELH